MMSVGAMVAAYHSAVALGVRNLKGETQPGLKEQQPIAPSWVPLQGQHKKRLENSTGTVNWRCCFGLSSGVERLDKRELFFLNR
jgi:hypothetical protein